MNWRKVLDGRPDGIGFAKDPGGLCAVYGNFEAACLRADLRNDNLSTPWHPLGTHLCELELVHRSRREMADLLLQALRLCEAGLATLEIFEHEAVRAVSAMFEKMPSHLKSSLFRKPLEGPNISDRSIMFRRAFRVAWQTANWDESVLLTRDWDDDDDADESWERVADKSAPTSIRIAESRFDFREMGYKADQDVRQPLRHVKRDSRAEVLALCQQAIQRKRVQLTAIMKAVYGRTQ